MNLESITVNTFCCFVCFFISFIFWVSFYPSEDGFCSPGVQKIASFSLLLLWVMRNELWLAPSNQSLKLALPILITYIDEDLLEGYIKIHLLFLLSAYRNCVENFNTWLRLRCPNWGKNQLGSYIHQIPVDIQHPIGVTALSLAIRHTLPGCHLGQRLARTNSYRLPFAVPQVHLPYLLALIWSSPEAWDGMCMMHNLETRNWNPSQA